MLLSDYDMECLAKAKEIMDKDLSIHYDTATLAKKVGLGNTKLKAGFRFLYGKGLYQYLQEQRMQHAMSILFDKTKTLKQVAKDVGFKHTNNFIAAFSKKFGISPGQIKKQAL